MAIKYFPATLCKPVLSETVGFFDQAFPMADLTAQNMTTQMGVHFEEVSEMVAEITSCDLVTNEALLNAKIALTHLADHLKAHPGCAVILTDNRKSYLDALVDQLVTAVGCARNEDMDIVGGLDEVNRSNFSKFVNGKPTYHPETAKLLKGPNYSPAELDPFI